MTLCQKENILYELFVYGEWRPDPDFIRGEIAKDAQTGLYERFISLLRSETLLENISSYLNQLQPWQMCLGDDGKVVAILQDSVLEIRTKRGNFSTIVARAGVPRDPHPQWRKMVWSPDCSILAISQSNGNVSFYDLMATTLFTIQSDNSQQAEILYLPYPEYYATSGIVFLTSRVDQKGIKQKWSSEVLLVDYRGCLRSFFVSPTDGYIADHAFSFEGGVSSITYHPSHNLLFVTGLPSDSKDANSPSFYGLRGWRLLNDSPFYKLSINLDADIPNTITSYFYSIFFPKWKNNNQSIVTRAVASPNGTLLGCLHLNGSVTLWHLPTLRFSKKWPLTSQPGFDLKSPLVPIGKHKVWPTFNHENAQFTPIDLSWWDDDALIISRLNGSITICSIADFQNLLGDHPEFLQGHPQISNTFDNGFLSLECEAMLISAKRLRKNSDLSEISAKDLAEIKDDEGDSSDEEKASFINRGTEVIKSALYVITDMERFQPKPKKLHLLSRVYRLLFLQSITPEDLFARKIENADFTEALSLAESYNLDSDLVYQQLWRTSRVTNQSIKEYLGKVSKKMWVIQQCCDRVPEALIGTKELLEFGLEISNEEMLKGVKSKNKNMDALKKLTVSDLTTQQSEIIRFRHTMLFYLDRLEIYKSIIQCESSSYSSEEYDNLRTKTITKSAIDLARSGRIQALDCLWPHLTQFSQQFLVLQNIPETLDPNVYKTLLPTCQTKQTPKNPKASEREKDWCENEIFKDIWDSNVWNDESEIESLENGSNSSKEPALDLAEWYSTRAKEIEKFSGLPSNSLKLITIAQEENVPGLEDLENLLITLNTLVYDVGVQDMTLQCLEGCSPFQIIKYLMSQSTESSIIDDITNILFPYLDRCQKLSEVPNLKLTLFSEYVINIAKDDLSLPIAILDQSEELELNTKTCLDLVDGCLLAQDSLDQLNSCFQLLHTLDKERDNSVVPSYFVKVYDEMERYLDACSLLDIHNVTMLYSDMKTILNYPKETIEILKKVANNTSQSTTPVSAEAWNKLLTHLLELQSKVFCCVDVEFCYEIYALALLSSSNKISIQSARQVLTCHPSKDPSPPSETFPLEKSLSTHKIYVTQRVPYDRSVSLVLEAAVKYFNSSTSISDPSLEYAWVCLQLIKHEDPTIEKERDLLLALKILQEFNLSILPLQVRLCTPKLALVEDCLNFYNKAYKSVDKLIYFAKLLRISQDNEKQREIIIVSLCAEKAVDNEDFDTCQSICRRLLTVTSDIPNGTEKAEKAARRLGCEPGITDGVLRRDLINLALLYCEPQHIETLIQMRSHVEAEMLKNEMNNLINLSCKLNVKQVNLQDSMESTDDDYVDALTSPLNENKTILSATNALEKYIQRPLLNLSEKSSWKGVLSVGWLSERNELEAEAAAPVLEDSNVVCPYFYSSLHQNYTASNIFTQYDKFSKPDVLDKQLMLLQALMRCNFLQDTVNYGCSEVALDDVLMQCAEQLLYEETALFLSQLLSVNDCSAFEKTFNKTFLDSKNITSVIYFYALWNYMEANGISEGIFSLSPSKVLSNAISIAQSCEDVPHPLANALMNCKDRYIELFEGEKLNLMGCDVDIRQFIDDEEYRKNVIVGLASTLSKEKYKTALELAVKYKIDEIEIAVTYLSHILKSCSEMGIAECMSAATELHLIRILKKDIALVMDHLINHVWNGFTGSDVQHLLLYLNVASKIDDNYSFAGLTVKEHIKLLKKMKSACSDINYKYLLQSPEQDKLMDHVLPYISNDNIGLVTKLLRNLPPCLNITFDSSKMYYRWLSVHFYNIPEKLQSPKKWIQQYRECSTFFNKLNKQDFNLFIENILFSLRAMDILPPNTRIQIAYQTAEFCHENTAEETKSNGTWNELGEEVKLWATFLEKIYSDSVQSILKNVNIGKDLCRSIEISKGVLPELQNALKLIVRYYETSFEDLEVLVESLSDNTLCVDDILLDILIQEDLEKNTLTNIVNLVTSAKANFGNVNPEIMDKLKPYTASKILSSKEKLELMSLFKTNYNEDVDMLIQITREMISNTWNENDFHNLDDERIQNEEKRDHILIQLIDLSNSWNKLHVIVDLVNMWMPKNTLEGKSTNPFLHLILKLLKNGESLENNIPLLKVLIEKNSINEDDVLKVVSQDDNSCHIIGKIWLCLMSNCTTVFENILIPIIAKENNAHMFEDHFDDHLISMIVNKGLVVSLVNTVLYPKCVQYLLRNDHSGSHGDGTYTTSMAVNDLLRNNFIAEAGSLRLASMGIPQPLRSFTQAIKFLKPRKS